MDTLTENKGFAFEKAREETRLAWLALAMSPGLGPKRIADAMRQVEAPIDILSLPLTALVDQFYAEVEAMGGARWDTSSLFARMEKLRSRQ